ncbi:hypothetical protein [Fusobacterium gastrosuis]|uniref:hypothetical protein n=1 Tax=Fusobacterium gastrosuis TaxID=1755100 RepID=UPI002971703E|nr:hypothetical protein [Fusobacteriaceae bacterium]MDY5713657.1 hypothetical protein [Fusobacterium gastrosuis]
MLGHGGARKGAGRKIGSLSKVKKENPKVQKAFRIDPILYKEFESIEPNRKIIDKLEEALRDFINKKNAE